MKGRDRRTRARVPAGPGAHHFHPTPETKWRAGVAISLSSLTVRHPAPFVSECAVGGGLRNRSHAQDRHAIPERVLPFLTPTPTPDLKVMVSAASGRA